MSVLGSSLPALGADVIDLAELCELFDEEYGKGWGPGMFGRKLREALPSGIDIRREMIHGERARRLIGMRYRKPRN